MTVCVVRLTLAVLIEKGLDLKSTVSTSSGTNVVPNSAAYQCMTGTNFTHRSQIEEHTIMRSDISQKLVDHTGQRCAYLSKHEIYNARASVAQNSGIVFHVDAFTHELPAYRRRHDHGREARASRVNSRS